MEFGIIALIGIGVYVLHKIIVELLFKKSTKSSYEREVMEVLNNPAYKVKGRFE